MRQTIIIVRFAVDVARLQNQVRFARLLTKVHQAFNVVEWLCRIWWVGHQNVILWRCFGSDTGIEVFAFVIHVWEAASSKLIFHTVLRIEGGLYERKLQNGFLLLALVRSMSWCTTTKHFCRYW